MSNISETLAAEIDEILSIQNSIRNKVMSALQLYKVTSVDTKSIKTAIVGRIVYHREGFGYFFIEENLLIKNIDKIIKDESVIDSLTSLRCKEDRWVKLVEGKTVELEEYTIKDPTIPDNIITPLF